MTPADRLAEVLIELLGSDVALEDAKGYSVLRVPTATLIACESALAAHRSASVDPDEAFAAAVARAAAERCDAAIMRAQPRPVDIERCARAAEIECNHGTGDPCELWLDIARAVLREAGVLERGDE